MQDAPAQKTWAVLVMDLFHYMDPEEETLVSGFAIWEDARDYARARTWSSVQELREPGMGAEKLKVQWWSFGETAIVVGEPHYSATDEIDFFLSHEPTAMQIDWTRIASRAGAGVFSK